MLWTAEEFYRLADLGFFLERRVELIEGVILERSPHSNYHSMALALTTDALRAAFGPGFWVRPLGSLDLTPISVPDPDLAVVPGSCFQPSLNNPTTALLIVEVSETTLAFDRHEKASLYARVGIADYWIVNLLDRHLEVRRNPVPDATARFGYRYGDETILLVGDFVSPLAAPNAQVAVADLLP
jgi:Uma2 family endonuclease